MHRAVFDFATGLSRVCEVLAALLVGAAVTINLAQVLWRYILNDPLEWSEEVMRYTMVWVAFLAGSAAVFRGEHMAAGMLGNLPSALIKRVLHYVILVAMLIFSFVLAWWGTWYGIDTGQVSPAAQIPMEIPYLAVGIGGILMMIKLICLLLLPIEMVPQPGAMRPEDIA